MLNAQIDIVSKFMHTLSLSLVAVAIDTAVCVLWYIHIQHTYIPSPGHKYLYRKLFDS
eukprot:COSAG01_NODE_664_length_14417_cov_18.499022_13_plen_58_part_00